MGAFSPRHDGYSKDLDDFAYDKCVRLTITMVCYKLVYENLFDMYLPSHSSHLMEGSHYKVMAKMYCESQ